MALGTDQLEAFRTACQTYGEALTVTRRKTSLNGTDTTQSIYFIVKAPGRGGFPQVVVEAMANAGDAEPTIFTCAGDETIQEATDWITYKGLKMRLANVIPQDVAGVTVCKWCIGVKEGV